MVVNSPYDIPVLPESELLRTYVKSICVSESTGMPVLPQKFNCYADGCPGIVFQQAEDPVTFNGVVQKHSEFYLYGQTIKPIQYQAEGRYRFIIVYLYPPVARYLFDIKAKDLTDACMDLSAERHAREMRIPDRLQDAGSSEEQVNIITGYVAVLARRHNFPGDRMLEYSIGQIHANADEKSLQTIRQELYITERTFERRFEQYVGISPRMYARIVRFQQTLKQLHARNYDRLSDLAFDNGFADQSHFIRTFKSFTGLTPSEFVRINAAALSF